MAYRRRRTNRRRRFRRRSRIPAQLVPQSRLTRLTATVHSSPTISTTVGGIAVSMTNINDPFGTGSSNQPKGYDQLAFLYDKAKVISSKVKFTVHNAGTELIVFGICPRYPNDGSTFETSWDEYTNIKGNKYKILSGDVDHAVMTYKRSNKKHFAINDIKDNQNFEVTLDGSSTAPTKNAFYHCYIQPFDSTTSTAVDFICVVEYIVLLYEPIDPASSAHT